MSNKYILQSIQYSELSITDLILSLLIKPEYSMAKACFICLEPGHIACDCPKNTSNKNYVLLKEFRTTKLIKIDKKYDEGYEVVDNGKLIISNYLPEEGNFEEEVKTTDYCTICSGIPSTTEKLDLHIFLNGYFGEICDLWIEKRNGNEPRYALIYFAKPEGVYKAVSIKYKIKFQTSYITLESCSEKLKELTYIRRTALKSEESYDEVSSQQRNTIQDLGALLKLLNYVRSTVAKREGGYPSISPNHLIQIKFACDILYLIVSRNHAAIEVIEEAYITKDLIQLFGSLGLDCINYYLTRTVKIFTENVTKYHKI